MPFFIGPPFFEDTVSCRKQSALPDSHPADLVCTGCRVLQRSGAVKSGSWSLNTHCFRWWLVVLSHCWTVLFENANAKNRRRPIPQASVCPDLAALAPWACMHLSIYYFLFPKMNLLGPKVQPSCVSCSKSGALACVLCSKHGPHAYCARNPTCQVGFKNVGNVWKRKGQDNK